MATVVVPIEAEDKTKAGVASAEKRLGGLKGRLGGIKGVAKGAALGIAGIAAVGIGVGAKLAKDFLETGDALHKMNLRTGIGVEELQKYKFAVEQSGSDLETFEKGIQTMAKGLFDAREKGTGPFADSIKALGLDISDFEGLNPDEQFDLLAESISNVEDPTKRAAIAQKIFGGAGKALLPTLLEGADGIAALKTQAEEAGNIMSGDTAASAAAFNDQMNVLKQELGSVAQEGFKKLIPVMISTINFLRDDGVPTVKLIVKWIRDEMIPAIVSFVKHLIDMPNKVKSALNQVITFFEGIGNSGVGAINAVLGAWNALQFELPSKTIFGKKIGGGSLGVPKIPLVPEVSLPRLAQGGIVSSPTVALIGEAGPEAVVPLGAGGGGGFGTTINNYYVNSLLTSQTQLDRMSVRANNQFARRRTGVLV